MKLTIWIAVGVICLSIWWAYDNQRENLSNAKDAIIEAQNEAYKKEMDALDDLQTRESMERSRAQYERNQVPVPPPVSLPPEYSK